jgi:hypothetical protein
MNRPGYPSDASPTAEIIAARATMAKGAFVSFAGDFAKRDGYAAAGSFAMMRAPIRPRLRARLNNQGNALWSSI